MRKLKGQVDLVLLHAILSFKKSPDAKKKSIVKEKHENATDY